MTTILNWADALAARTDNGKRSVLLGNGFSVACRQKIFRYDAIFDRFTAALDEVDAERMARVFDAFATRDFEEVLRALKSVEAVAPYYGVSAPTLGSVRQDQELIRRALVDALASSHPAGPHEITTSEFQGCAAFLQHFREIYTLNYDLLLYWTVLNQRLDGVFRDGFGEPETENADYVEWALGQEIKANVHYLHGALHLFAAGSRVRKVSWCRTGKTLKEQIAEQLKHDRFPLFVAEGTAEGKMTAISRNAYLSRSYRSFQGKGGDLFVLGCSLGDADTHIVRAIDGAQWRSLSVGIFGDPESEHNRALVNRCEAIATRRTQRTLRGKRKPPEFDLSFFDSASTAVWGPAAQVPA